MLLVAPSDLLNASDSFYWMIMVINQIYDLLTYLLLQLVSCLWGPVCGSCVRKDIHHTKGLHPFNCNSDQNARNLSPV